MGRIRVPYTRTIRDLRMIAPSPTLALSSITIAPREAIPLKVAFSDTISNVKTKIQDKKR